jgi:hypothetical protein
MADYRLETHLKTGEYIATLPYRNIQSESFMNKPGHCRFDLPLYHESITQETLQAGIHEIWMYKNGRYIWGGPLWDVTPSSHDASINCNAGSFEDYLDVRRIDFNTQAVTKDQVYHAWDLIADTQARPDGALGITAGILQTGVSRTRTWSIYDAKMILEAIQDMNAEEDGFDFYITPWDRKFNAFYPRPQRNVGLELTYPTSIRSYSVNIMGKWLRNDVLIQGPTPLYEIAVDTASRAMYGLREFSDAYKDATNISQIASRAGKTRDDRRRPKYNYQVSINTDEIDIYDPSILQFGDIVKMTIKDGYVNISESYRYVGHQVSVSKQGSESVVLYMNDLREVAA